MGRPLRILLAEHNPTDQLVIRLLKGLAIKVDVANDSAEAVQAASRTGYDTISMDMRTRMPVMEGLEATRQIRRHAGPTAHGGTARRIATTSPCPNATNSGRTSLVTRQAGVVSRHGPARR